MPSVTGAPRTCPARSASTRTGGFRCATARAAPCSSKTCPAAGTSAQWPPPSAGEPRPFPDHAPSAEKPQRFHDHEGLGGICPGSFVIMKPCSDAAAGPGMGSEVEVGRSLRPGRLGGRPRLLIGSASAQVELAAPYSSGEGPPLIRAEHQLRAVRVLGVTDGDDTRQVAGHLDAVPAVAAGVGALAPLRAV